MGLREMPKILSDDPQQNRLLAALPQVEWARWLPQLELIDMPLGKVLYESGNRLTHVYFPTSTIVSLPYVMEDGASAEIAVVGYEALVGACPCSWGAIHAQPGGGAKRRQGLPAQGEPDDAGVQPGRCCTCCCATRRR